MARAKLSDKEFIELYQLHGPAAMAKIVGIAERNIYARHHHLEGKYQTKITSPRARSELFKYPQRQLLEIHTGTVLIASDAHYWPGPASAAHRALVKFAADMQPAAIIMNGDVIDGSTVSRFPPIGWEQRPSLVDEIEAAQLRLNELAEAAPRAHRIWPLGNHDGRFETRLASVAPEYARIKGMHLQDHFPAWTPAWSAWINDSVVVKHRFKGGIHAAYNNTVLSGKTLVSGHLHSLQVRPFTDYNGTRWGVDTGTLALVGAPQFVDYTEDNPKDWRQGFVVLTFYKGTLLWPEVVYTLDDNHVSFRGEVLKV